MCHSLGFVASFLMVCAVLGQARQAKAPALPDAPPKTVKQMLAPTLISLHCKDLSAADAVKLLEEELGAELRKLYQPDHPGPVTCDHTAQPYWKVIADLCRQGEMSFSLVQQRPGSPFVLTRHATPGATMLTPRFQDSAVLPVIERIAYPHLQSRRPDGQAFDMSKLELSMLVLAEPKVFLAGYDDMAAVEQAIDEAGKNLVVRQVLDGRSTTQIRFLPLDQGQFPQLRLTIMRPRGRVARLRGGVRIYLGLDPVTHDLTGMLSGQPVDVSLPGVGKFRFEGFTKRPPETPGYQFQMQFPGNRREQIQNTLEFRAMRLTMTTAKGDRFGYRGIYRAEETVNGVFSLPPNGSRDAPTKLIWTIPRRVKEVILPFEFVNLALPDPAERPRP